MGLTRRHEKLAELLWSNLFSPELYVVGSSWAPAFFNAGFRPTFDASGPAVEAWTSTYSPVCQSSPIGRGSYLWVLDRRGLYSSQGSDFYELHGTRPNLREHSMSALLYQAPIPATVPLLGLGLAALGFNRRKRLN